MNLDAWLSISVLIFSAIAGGLVRRLSGFGGALIMSPLLMWIFPIPSLIPIVMSSEIFGGILLSRQWKLHGDDRLRLWKMLAYSAIFLPLGLLIANYTSTSLIKMFTSLVVLLFAFYLLSKPHLRIPISKLFDGLAGALSGLLLGSCGIGGPPAALYLNATHQEFMRTRALLSQFVSGISVFAIIGASLMGAGLDWLYYLLVAIPAYSLGMYCGGRLLMQCPVSDAAIKRLCLLLLAFNAIFNLSLLFISKLI
ncbi:MAG: sulfite exporter TauE/SafE family protein [Polynucleobacter sp.]|uniref:sulfite exporter TauE/SafE family protein n=1 Tax=Polynucleobacter sp. TaxID=2029855 RepID=UPI0027263A00|nr:sulfite exporter TauE/SafE family protein [Polynucleobacter sp.]MDO8713503.1 sulfite exporter TauE/SafE family protein [Polynucleobacter sp.]